MQREEIIRICDREVLDTASRLFGIRKGALTLVAGYEGCANLVCEYKRDGQPFILRISFRPDRTAEQIRIALRELPVWARRSRFQASALSKRETA